jgi:LacI family transcriptional regulator
MSVAAIDDFPWATAFRPALTTVRQPVSEIARHAVALVEKRIAGDRSDPVRVELAAELMIRESVARPEPSRADTR